MNLPSSNAPLTGDDPLYRTLCRLLSAPQNAENQPLDELDDATWESLISLAESEGAAPLLYSRFQAGGWPAGISSRARASLTGAYYRSVARYSLLKLELEKILNALADADIPAVVLKGMALAGRIYPDPALRPMSDLDLLIPAGKVKAALGCLEGCGYRVQKSSYHTVLWGGPGGQVNVELHWSLTPGLNGRGQENGLNILWKSAYPLEDLPGLAFDPETDLLYLAAHLILQHGGRPRLIWLYDLHLYLSAHAARLDWPALFERAALLGWELPLAAALSQTQTKLGSPLPEDCERLCAGALQLAPMGYADFMVWNRAALDELPLSLRVRFLMNLLFPAKAYILWRYRPRPAWLWPLCYLERVAALMRQAAAHGLRRSA